MIFVCADGPTGPPSIFTEARYPRARQVSQVKFTSHVSFWFPLYSRVGELPLQVADMTEATFLMNLSFFRQLQHLRMETYATTKILQASLLSSQPALIYATLCTGSLWSTGCQDQPIQNHDQITQKLVLINEDTKPPTRLTNPIISPSYVTNTFIQLPAPAESKKTYSFSSNTLHKATWSSSVINNLRLNQSGCT